MCVVTYLFAKKYKLHFFQIADCMAVAGSPGLFFGRMGNFINGELYGRTTTVPWAVYFPKELYASDPERVREVLVTASAANPQWGTLDAVLENAGRPELRGILEANLSPRHPSQIYEGLLEGALLFSILWILRTRFRLPDGVLTGVFFIAYAVLRIVGEFFREPDAPLTGMFTRGQFLSLFLVLMGIGFLIAAKARPTWAPKFR
jgi:phosphatidylglycerol:prolipoprotein diacylglycerol transferase